jgi:hypothetical protein
MFGVPECKDNIFLIRGLDYQSWIHVVILSMAGGCILVAYPAVPGRYWAPTTPSIVAMIDVAVSLSEGPEVKDVHVQ